MTRSLAWDKVTDAEVVSALKEYDRARAGAVLL